VHTKNFDSDQPIKGIALAILATLLFAFLNSMTKHVSQVYPVVMILWFRYLFFGGYGLAVGLKMHKKRAFSSLVPILQVTRAVLLMAEVGVYVFAFRHLPLAEISAISGSGPVVTMAMSAIILREIVTSRQWLIVGIGFIGILIIIKPGFSSFNPWMLIPLLGTCLWGLYQVLTRLVSQYDGSDRTTMFTGTIGFILICLVLPFYWQPVNMEWIGKFAILAIFGVAGHSTLIKALSIAPASLLQPFSYFSMIWAVIFGWIFFDNAPETTTILGSIIIILSGIYLFRIKQHESIVTKNKN
jgi:drug/metabolite transporter (DMT)-like permease